MFRVFAIKDDGTEWRTCDFYSHEAAAFFVKDCQATDRRLKREPRRYRIAEIGNENPA